MAWRVVVRIGDAATYGQFARVVFRINKINNFTLPASSGLANLMVILGEAGKLDSMTTHAKFGQLQPQRQFPIFGASF